MQQDNNGEYSSIMNRKEKGVSTWKLLRRGRFVEEFVDDHDILNVDSPILLICLVLLAIAGLGCRISVLVQSPSVANAIFTSLWFASALLLLVQRPRQPPLICLIIFTGIFLSELVLLEARWSNSLSQRTYALVDISCALIACVLVVNMPLRDPSLPRNEISQPFTEPTKQLRSPEDSLTLWQWMSISWLTPLIKLGNKRQLHDEDVWKLGYEFQHRHLHDNFRELKGTVVRRLLLANWIDLVLLSILAILELVANYSIPILFQKLLQSMEDVQFNKRPAIVWALVAFIARLVAAQSGVFSLWFGRRCYERSRGEMITMLYEKTLNRKVVGTVLERTDPTNIDDEQSDGNESTASTDDLKQKVDARWYKPWFPRWMMKIITREPGSAPIIQKQPASMGKILNLMRNDVYEVSQRFWEFQSLVNKPLGLILSLILVWRLIGWPCLIGVAVIIVAQIINALLARSLIKCEKIRRSATDQRLQRTSQYVESIRHLRWYAWQSKWLDKIMEARQTELNLKIITYLWNIAIRFTNVFASGLYPIAAFWAFTVLAKQQLTVDIAFPALQLFNILQSNLRDLPNLITVMLNAAVAVGRIEDFMNEPNKEDLDSEEFTDSPLELKKATFTWPGQSKTVLHELSLSFPTGLTIISGPVAAGKSALLQALLGELDLQSGDLSKPCTSIGYCAQTPWLESMSIRENILFTSPYEEIRYKKILEACALTPDLATFKHGDLSNIGENGIGLSGGQKARVALARAVYSQTKYLLLDDPLSALDQQTAESIVQQCFKTDLLEGRSIVLVTHRVDLCNAFAVQHIEITEGRASVTKSQTAFDLSQEVHTSKNQSEEEDLDSAMTPDKFEDEEYRAHGGVQSRVYWEYIKAGKLKWWLFVLVAALTCRVVMIAQWWFVKEWGEAYDKANEQIWLLQSYLVNISSNPLAKLFDHFPDPSKNVQPWLLGFFVLVVLQAISVLISECFMLVITYSAGRTMFKDIIKSVTNTTFRFYDVTPIGRLLNRLTSDIGTIDGNISNQFLEVAWQGIAWIASIVVIASITPVYLIFSILLTLAFVVIFLQFLPTSQSLRRLEMVSLSPLMSNFGALLNGLMTVRAFCAQPQFQARVIVVTDTFQKMDHFYWSAQGWLMYRFDLLSACSTFTITLLAVLSGLTPGLTAFLLGAAARFVESTHILCKQYGNLQLNFVSVERVVELLHLEQEETGSVKPPAWWPAYGSEIVFENVTMRYAVHLDPALENINFSLKGGTSTAIIGRTGSGKSTLASSLLATIIPESGRILIDGVDIAKVEKQILRQRITYLAQEPVLFPGSLRHNLDPVEEHSENECEQVLERVCGTYGWTLNTQIDAGGKNLSQGQRQLVGLARAVLRKSSVIIMDEATASIDLETAWDIQRILREEMKGSTVITIAHRSSAVRDADYCIALGDGKIIAQGRPDEIKLD